MLNSIRLPLLLVAALMLQACVVPPRLAVPEQIIRALQTRHYADAIRAARQGQASLAEIDFAAGEIVLQGWADESPVQRPVETLDQGIALLEKSALTGHAPAISGLAALFFTGLSQGEMKLIAPNRALHRCWNDVENGIAHAATCVAGRN